MTNLATLSEAEGAAGANNPPAVGADRPPLVVMRQGRSLIPATPFDIEMVAKFSPTRPIHVHLSQERHSGQHRLYFAILTIVARNVDTPVRPEDLHEWIKRETGVASIAFGAMDQPGFHDFFQLVLDLLTTRIIPGLSREALRREASALIGFAA